MSIKAFRKSLRIKVCGMRYAENIQSIIKNDIDYIGFIFYEKSPRCFQGMIPWIPPKIKKVGVFVEHNLLEISQIVEKYNLDALQLHGDESPELCKSLKKQFPNKEIIKAFSVSSEFDFLSLGSYVHLVDYFLFDTKGEHRGGNGTTFDWNILKKYPYSTPFFLSGGIGIEQIEPIQHLERQKLPLIGVDINSRFEISAGLKNDELIRQFTEKIKLPDSSSRLYP